MKKQAYVTLATRQERRVTKNTCVCVYLQKEKQGRINFKLRFTGASLVAQWLAVGIRLPMQGTRVQALVWEDPICHGAPKCWQRCGAKGTPIHCWWKCILVQPLGKIVWSFLKNTKK